jgi:hypothetical protein
LDPVGPGLTGAATDAGFLTHGEAPAEAGSVPDPLAPGSGSCLLVKRSSQQERSASLFHIGTKMRNIFLGQFFGLSRLLSAAC